MRKCSVFRVACSNQHFNGVILTNFPTWGGQGLVNQYVKKSIKKRA